MGRNNKKYRKDLHQQLYDKFNKMIAFGESKREAKQNGTIKNKIFSYSTYKTYYRHAKAFVDWMFLTCHLYVREQTSMLSVHSQDMPGPKPQLYQWINRSRLPRL